MQRSGRLLSRPPCEHSSSLNDCGVFFVTVELPHRDATVTRNEHLKDPDLSQSHLIK